MIICRLSGAPQPQNPTIFPAVKPADTGAFSQRAFCPQKAR